MDDFVFGTLASDDLKLNYHRLAHSGIQHNHQRQPLDPAPGEPVILIVQTGQDLSPDHMAAYVTLDGSDPQGSRGESRNGAQVRFERAKPRWDSVLWEYVTPWSASLPPQPDGTRVRYKIGAWSEGQDEIFADWPEVKESSDRSAAAFFRGQPVVAEWIGDPGQGQIFAFHVDRLAPPEWARRAVLYHIFVDRFSPGQGRSWLQTRNLKAPFGGTLPGITEKLDYITELGADCLWLSPIFPSPTAHGYDVLDFRQVGPRVGGDAALRELVTEAHRRGVRVILDLVCNHISHEHPIFLHAQSDPGSRYRPWFHFDEPTVGYRTFFGVRSMPQVNLAETGAREWMIENARFWLREFDVDGFRLDHAHGPGPGFWADFWAACKDEKPDCFVFGELVEPADIVRRYTGTMDAVLDFHIAKVLRSTFGLGDRSERQMSALLDAHYRYFDPNLLLLTFVDNHDMDRFLYLAAGDKRKLRRAVEAQMRLPGPPVIYYGTEVGLSQQTGVSRKAGLEASRLPMPWGRTQDRELFEFYQRVLLERRQSRPWAALSDQGRKNYTRS